MFTVAAAVAWVLAAFAGFAEPHEALMYGVPTCFVVALAEGAMAGMSGE